MYIANILYEMFNLNFWTVVLGCDVNFSDPYGHVTPLHVAVNSLVDFKNFNEILQILIEGGV